MRIDRHNNSNGKRKDWRCANSCLIDISMSYASIRRIGLWDWFWRGPVLRKHIERGNLWRATDGSWRLTPERYRTA